jgi:hypothetical protein
MIAAPMELSLDEVYSELSCAAEVTKQPAEEDWYAFAERISVPGRINEITEDAYQFFLESSPPKLLGTSRFCWADGEQPLRVFWTTDGRYYCRQLTRQETNRLCDASGLPREYAIYLA